MKSGNLSKFITVGVLCMAAGSVAFANDKASDVLADYCQHAKTRAQVVAELNEARAQGLLSYSEADFPNMPKFISTKTRAQVVAELNEARTQGLLNYSEADFPRIPESVSTTTRAQVIAKTNEARAQGLLSYSEANFPKTPIVPNCG